MYIRRTHHFRFSHTCAMHACDLPSSGNHLSPCVVSNGKGCVQTRLRGREREETPRNAIRSTRRRRPSTSGDVGLDPPLQRNTMVRSCLLQLRCGRRSLHWRGSWVTNPCSHRFAASKPSGQRGTQYHRRPWAAVRDWSEGQCLHCPGSANQRCHDVAVSGPRRRHRVGFGARVSSEADKGGIPWARASDIEKQLPTSRGLRGDHECCAPASRQHASRASHSTYNGLIRLRRRRLHRDESRVPPWPYLEAKLGAFDRKGTIRDLPSPAHKDEPNTLLQHLRHLRHCIAIGPGSAQCWGLTQHLTASWGITRTTLTTGRRHQ